MSLFPTEIGKNTRLLSVNTRSDLNHWLSYVYNLLHFIQSKPKIGALNLCSFLRDRELQTFFSTIYMVTKTYFKSRVIYLFILEKTYHGRDKS